MLLDALYSLLMSFPPVVSVERAFEMRRKMCLCDICAVSLRKQQKTGIQNRPSHYHDSAEEWILQRSSSSPLTVSAYEYHLGREKNDFEALWNHPLLSVFLHCFVWSLLEPLYHKQTGRGRARELTSWYRGRALAHWELVDRYKRLQLTPKKSIGYWKSDNTLWCKCTLQAKKPFPIRVQCAAQLYTAALSLFQRKQKG